MALNWNKLLFWKRQCVIHPPTSQKSRELNGIKRPCLDASGKSRLGAIATQRWPLHAAPHMPAHSSSNMLECACRNWKLLINDVRRSPKYSHSLRSGLEFVTNIEMASSKLEAISPTVNWPLSAWISRNCVWPKTRMSNARCRRVRRQIHSACHYKLFGRRLFAFRLRCPRIRAWLCSHREIVSSVTYSAFKVMPSMGESGSSELLSWLVTT
jgi:hypothetical protein